MKKSLLRKRWFWWFTGAGAALVTAAHCGAFLFSQNPAVVMEFVSSMKNFHVQKEIPETRKLPPVDGFNPKNFYRGYSSYHLSLGRIAMFYDVFGIGIVHETENPGKWLETCWRSPSLCPGP